MVQIHGSVEVLAKRSANDNSDYGWGQAVARMRARCKASQHAGKTWNSDGHSSGVEAASVLGHVMIGSIPYASAYFLPRFLLDDP